MPAVFRKCKVCGVEYPYCKTVVKDGVFRYQDVACCPEHGSIYLAKIMESRSTESNEPKNTVDEPAKVDDIEVTEKTDIIDDVEDVSYESVTDVKVNAPAKKKQRYKKTNSGIK